MKPLLAPLLAAALAACAASRPAPGPAPICTTDLECARLPELPPATPV